MAFELELDVEPPPKRLRAGKVGLWERQNWVCPGPADARAAVHWALADLDSLATQGAICFGVQFEERLKTVLNSGVILRTDYSGIGGAEEALQQIITACNERLSSSTTASSVQRSGDLLSHCRWLLCQHRGATAPQCVHGNILDRMPKHILKRVERMLLTYQGKALALEKKGEMKKCDIYDKMGKEFMVKASKLVFEHTPRAADLVAACDVHEGEACPVLPPLPLRCRQAGAMLGSAREDVHELMSNIFLLLGAELGPGIPPL